MINRKHIIASTLLSTIATASISAEPGRMATPEFPIENGIPA